MTGDRVTGVAGVAGVAGAAGVVGLTAAGQRWTTALGVGSTHHLGPWAVAVVVACVPVSVAIAAGYRRGRRSTPSMVVVGLAAATALAALAAATARLVGTLTDDATVGTVVPTAAGWVAPGALAVAAGAGALASRGRARAAVAVGSVVALAVGAAFGMRTPSGPQGDLTAASGARQLGGQAVSLQARVVAAVDGVVYGGNGGELEAIDERGRWFPVADLDEVRPRLYTGHQSSPYDDAVGVDDPVGLFAWNGGLAVAARQGVFTVGGPGPSRMLVALADGRSEASLAALRADGVPLVDASAGRPVLGAGPDGAGGILLLTPGGLVRRTGAGDVVVQPGTAALAAGDGGRPAIVLGRADGSALVSRGCVVWDVPATGAPVELARRAGADGGCVEPATVALDDTGAVVSVRRDGTLVGALAPPDDLLVGAALTRDDGGGWILAHEGGVRRVEVVR